MRRSISLVDLTESGHCVEDMEVLKLPSSTGKLHQNNRPLRTCTKAASGHRAAPGGQTSNIAIVHQRGVRSRMSLNFDNTGKHRFRQADIDLLKEIMHRKMAVKLQQGELPAEELADKTEKDATGKSQQRLAGDTDGEFLAEAINMQLLTSSPSRRVSNGEDCLVFRQPDAKDNSAKPSPAHSRSASPVTVQHIRSASRASPRHSAVILQGNVSPVCPKTARYHRQSPMIHDKETRRQNNSTADREDGEQVVSASHNQEVKNCDGRLKEIELSQNVKLQHATKSHSKSPSSRKVSSKIHGETRDHYERVKDQCDRLPRDDVPEKEIKTQINKAKALSENQTWDCTGKHSDISTLCHLAAEYEKNEQCLDDNRTCESINEALVRNKRRASKSRLKDDTLDSKCSSRNETQIFTIS